MNGIMFLKIMFMHLLSLSCQLRGNRYRLKWMNLQFFRPIPQAPDLKLAVMTIKIVFNLETGRMESFAFKGKELVRKGPEPDFWRPPTDNDYGYDMDKTLGVWKKAGEKSKVKKVDISQPRSGKL